MVVRRFRSGLRVYVLGLASLGFFAGSAVAGVVAQIVATPTETAARDEMVVLPDGRRLQMRCTGEGGPTLILDAGLGLDVSVWTRVESELAAMTRTCAYNRAGYGRSDAGPAPRDAARRANDLMGLLDATSESGPFVVVAHSAAEIPARLAAARRPDVVAGLVLVDPGADLDTLKLIGPGWAAAFDAGQAGALVCVRAAAAGDMTPGNAIYVECGSPPTDSPLASRTMAAAVLSENEPDPAAVVAVSNAPASLGALPVIVLTAGNKFGANEGAAPDETAGLRRAWADAGAVIAATSTRGEQRLVPEASHVIQFEQPQALIDAVRDVVDQVRALAPDQGSAG